MCMPVSPKKVAANCGTGLRDTLANSPAARWSGQFRKHRKRQAFCDQLAPFPAVKNNKAHAAGHGGQQPKPLRFRVALTAARTARTMVNELVSKNAVMMVAFTMLSEWNGVGQFGVEIRP